MTHIRDKTVSDLIADFKTLKAGEAWKVLGAIGGVLIFISGVSFYLGGIKSDINAAQCILTLERRTKLLQEVVHDANWDVTNKINQELHK